MSIQEKAIKVAEKYDFGDVSSYTHCYGFESFNDAIEFLYDSITLDHVAAMKLHQHKMNKF